MLQPMELICMKNMFRIQNRKNGLFSTGGMAGKIYEAKENKIGKFWVAEQYVKSHLSTCYWNWRYDATNYDIVEYQLVEVRRIPMKEYCKQFNIEKEDDKNKPVWM